MLILHCDELWSFVGRKSNKAWVWLARDAGSGRVVGLHVGRRDEAAARAFWNGLPAEYRRRGLCLTDSWAAYAAIPRRRRLAVSKRSGIMNRIERLNGTLRQRLGRLTRRTLSFSKSMENHVGCLRYFLNDYNQRPGLT